MTSTDMLVETLEYYRNAARKESNPVIRALYVRQAALLANRLAKREVKSCESK